jgi:PBP1b-binding outer membrane lipoprotein LpoB
MCKRAFMVLFAVVLAGCGGSPDEQQATVKAPPPAAQQNTELRDAAQAPLERAQAVQQTLDQNAAKLDAETKAAVDGNAAPADDPNATKDDDDTDGEE